MGDTGVHVVGMGVCNAIAGNVAAFDAGLRAGRSGVGRIGNRPGFPLSAYDFELALTAVTGTGAGAELGMRARSLGRRCSVSMQSALTCTLEAWADAGLDQVPIAPDHVALIVAGQYTTGEIFASGVTKTREAPDFVSPRFALETQETFAIGLISDLLNIRGEGFCVGGASASGNVAIIRAEQLLRSGQADACVVCAASPNLSELDMLAFKNLGAMGGGLFLDTPERAYRPFDRERDGFVYGQGSACIILERAGSMIGRGRTPRAAIRGGVSRLSAHAGAASCVDTEIRVMRQAIAMAGLTSGDVDYVNAHGSGSVLGDEVEARAIVEVFGPGNVRVNSTKSLIGHCLGAAGMQELIAMVLQLNGNYRHVSANIDDPIASDIALVRELTQETGRYAVSNSFGFSGIHSSVLIEGYTL
jgi:malonyl-ACP decarboxylase